MLNILIGKDWKANRNRILSYLADDVKHRRGGRILMVPELISHDTERRLAEAAGDTCSRYAEVLSFSRLASRVAESEGSGTPACLDNGGRMVAMAAATRQLHFSLKAYASVENRPEFLKDMLNIIDEFKRCCISSEDLRKASKKTEGEFAQKLEELALIVESYDSVTARSKRDPRDQMTWLLEQLEVTDFAQTHSFYIDGFPDFTRQHSAILEFLISNSPMVTISLNCDEVGSRLMAFERAGKTAADLLDYARGKGVPFKVTVVGETDSVFGNMCSRLYQGNTAYSVPLADRLFLFKTDSVYMECIAAASRVLSLAQKGCRYRDIGIVCADMPKYENAVRLAFSGTSIPVYKSGTDDVLQKTVIQSLVAALNAALGGYDRQDMHRYMKTVMCVLDIPACDAVENYSILWGISGKSWTKPWENHPDGLNGKWDGDSEVRLAELEMARKTLVEPLVRLNDGICDASKLSDQVKALYLFFEDIHLSERLQDLSEYMDSIGDNRSAQILNQLWEILVAALEQLHDVLGDTVWEAESFVRLFTLLLGQYDVGTIPTVLDSVVVGPISAMRCHEVKHLILLGASEDALPGYSGATGVLSDRERELLRGLDVPLTGGGMEGLQSAFAEIYGVFCSATETVAVYCGQNSPSFVYTRLAAMIGGEKDISACDMIATVDPVEFASGFAMRNDRNAAVELGIETEYDRVKAGADFELGTLCASSVRDLYGNKLELSASQVDKQADCRFSYFLRYGIHAKELKEATVDPAEFGTYFHWVLECTVRRVMELGGFHAVSLDDTMELALAYSSQYIAERFSALDSARLSYLFERNVKELMFLIRELWEELSVSKFEPDQFELGFGDGMELPAVQIPSESMDAQLRGFVDRVDKWNDGRNNYFRVVDYKSGKKSFDYCDVFNGMGLQMLLYMFALEQGGGSVLGDDPVPVGVQYFSANFPYLKAGSLWDNETAQTERGKALRRKGLVLNDESVLDAMQPEGAPKRLMVDRKKSGELSGDLADSEQFSLLRKYVFRILGKLVDDISSGNVSPNPYTRGGSHDACRFCPYGAVCHKATVSGRRDYQSMTAKRFWEEIEKEVGTNGG